MSSSEEEESSEEEVSEEDVEEESLEEEEEERPTVSKMTKNRRIEKRRYVESGMINSPIPGLTTPPPDEETFEDATSDINELLKDEKDVGEEETEGESTEESKYEVILKRVSSEGDSNGCDWIAILDPDPKYLEAIIASQKIDEEVTMGPEDFSPHKTREQYICPRVEVEKFMKGRIMKHKRLWEVNFATKMFMNLKQSDCSFKSSFPFDGLTWLEMVPQNNVLVLSFRSSMNKKPRKLKCASRTSLWKLYELVKFSMQIPHYIPELKGSTKGQKKVKIVGEIAYQTNKGGKMLIEKKSVDGTEFLVGGAKEQILVYCVTWNLHNAKLPTDDNEKNSLLFKILRPGATVYTICLQNLRQKKVGFYRDYLNDFFTKKFGFVLINGTRSIDVGMYVFIDRKFVRRISKIMWTKKTFPKTVCSSGSVTVRFLFNESPLAFVAVKLPKLKEDKIGVIEEVFSDLDLSNSDHHVFLLGYFGYTISLPQSLAIEYSRNKKSLLEYDEFRIHREQTGLFHGFMEGEIKYPPIEPIEGEKKWKFSTSKKKGPLGYTSRILVKSFPGLECKFLKYDSVRSLYYLENIANISKTAPVFGIYGIDTQRVHISHFARNVMAKVIKMGDLCVTKNTGKLFKNPVIVFEANWLQKFPIISKKVSGLTINPMFRSKTIPAMEPVKYSAEFLSSVFLKVSIKEEKTLRCRGILNMSAVVCTEDGYFSIGMCLGAKRICQLVGSMKLVGKDEK